MSRRSHYIEMKVSLYDLTKEEEADMLEDPVAFLDENDLLDDIEITCITCITLNDRTGRM